LRKVLLYSFLLIGGLVGSQLLPPALAESWSAVATVIRVTTMVCLAFLMIHVGYEFDLDKSNLRQYGWDYVVAATAAAFPWIFVAVYFVLVLGGPGAASSGQAWKESLLAGRFAAPTSAGVLFSMLAAAGLSATWVFRKARILAIFDDLDTVLLMIPLKMMMVGVRWQLIAIVAVMAVLLGLAWRYLHRVRWPVSWEWVLGYSAVIVAACEGIYRLSKLIDDVVPIHLEVLLPAFVLGCMLARPAGSDPHRDDAREGHQEGPENPAEQRVSTIVSALFMVFVGLSMPSLAGIRAAGTAWPGWNMVAGHVLLITILSNLGKMFPVFCYRREADWRQRLGLAVGMFPRGEVGAGVLVVSLSYGILGLPIAVAMISLALNLLLTGVFIVIVKRLIAASARARA